MTILITSKALCLKEFTFKCSAAVHCYAYREKETKETIECTGALRSEVCLYEENWLGTVGFHSGPRPLCELYLLLTWINGLTQYTVRNACRAKILRSYVAKIQRNLKMTAFPEMDVE